MSETERIAASAAACPSFISAMDIVGRRWNGLIVQAIGDGCASFSAIARYADGLSDAMLARRLRELESDGLIIREVVDARPPVARYSLTPAGTSLRPILDALTSWGETFTPTGQTPFADVEESH